MVDRPARLPDGTYILAVQSLYRTLPTTVIIAIAFIGVGLHISVQSPDRPLFILMLIGTVAVLARLGVLLWHRRRAADDALDLPTARRVERAFAISYLSFAGVFGAFSARAFQIATAESHMLVIGLLFGYGAGVAAGIFLRPWIALPAMLMAIVPSIVVALMSVDTNYIGAGLLLAIFLAGGMHSLWGNYSAATTEITTRTAYAKLARADALTGLNNRLSLREAYDAAMARARPNLMVVHCLDLDRFKAVNDRYGHPVGDVLLQAVADRLRRHLRAGDVAARVGGDEFVLLQFGAQLPEEAELFARRIVRAISEPYAVQGHQLSIGTSVGYALYPEHGRDLDDLIACADSALIGVKGQGGGVALYRPDVPTEPEPHRWSA
ncbi:MAG: GGDEF domain-containing protein [Alphaproteobacteria bacterium HGW-Alphaproteobacteria-16]|nr:MAG: GGDEF domain-containing protein [Alphaproteobacteria bacterium HGW-Alphaproteobacteria-16]